MAPDSLVASVTLLILSEALTSALNSMLPPEETLETLPEAFLTNK
jgi:hypothetical protein